MICFLPSNKYLRYAKAKGPQSTPLFCLGFDFYVRLIGIEFSRSRSKSKSDPYLIILNDPVINLHLLSQLSQNHLLGKKKR